MSEAAGSSAAPAEAGSAPSAPSAAAAPAAPDVGQLPRRGSWPVETAAGMVRGVMNKTSSITGSLAPQIGDLSFITFTAFLCLLFLFAFSTSSILVIASSRADQHGLNIGTLVQFGNYAWISVQVGLLVDLAITYNKYYRPCRFCARICSGCCQSPPAPSPDSVRREETPDTTSTSSTNKMGESSFRQPQLWRLLRKCLRIELTPRNYLLILSTILPLNVLFFYTRIGSPVFEPTRLEGLTFDVDALLENWPQGGGLIVDPERDVVTAEDGSLFPVDISSKACFSPDSPEFRILARLHKEERPKQAYCESLLGTAMVGFTKEHGSQESWQQDHDVWEEGFDFIVRIFGALAGLVADKQLYQTGGFLEDMTDVFDMYMLTFADVQQLHEGRPLLAGSHRLFWHSMSYQSWVQVFLTTAYLTMVMRALALIGFTPISDFLQRCGSPAPKTEIRVFTIALASLVFIEVPFLTMRWIGWYEYGIPVSVLAVKNIFHIYGELQLIGVFGSGGDPENKRTPVCCWWRLCPCKSSQSDAEAPAG